ncbi:MAG: hypothetical protein Q7J45_00795 [bacterium]|nr:hypothetical protein [bacterium]
MIDPEDAISQEYDCPNGNIDFDILGNDILCVGESVYCSCCGREHVAGGDLPDLQTMVHVIEDGEFRQAWWGLPQDAEEKKAWTAMSMAALEAHQATLGVLPPGSGWHGDVTELAHWSGVTPAKLKDLRFLYASNTPLGGVVADSWATICDWYSVVLYEQFGLLFIWEEKYFHDDCDWEPERIDLDELAERGEACKHDPQFSAFVAAYVAEGRSPW